jgi:cytochrome c oxidase cbb3-type subunit 1
MSNQSPQSSEQDTLLRAAIDRSLRHPVMFFFTSGAAWLAIAMLLGIISSAKVHNPYFLDGCPLMNYGRVFPAHINALVYGWGFQAAFGVMIWLIARLSRQKCRASGTVLMAGHLWNLGVGAGVLAILFGHGTGMPWMEFPKFVWPVLLLSYSAIIIWSFIQFRVSMDGHAPVSQWYLLGAMLWFPWIYLTANVLLHCVPGHPLMAAGINAWFKSALILLFFVPVALAVAYYLVPKITGRPIYSHALAQVGFWSLAIIAPWAGMQKLSGIPIPAFLPNIGAAAAILFAIPALAAGFNLLKTVSGEGEIAAQSPSLRFTIAGIAGLFVLGAASLFLNLPESTLRLTQFSISGYGYEVLAMYGFFSFTVFGAMYFIVPRLTLREWLSARLIKVHFYFSMYGVIIVALVALFGGLQQGVGQEDITEPWIIASGRAIPFAVAITFAWCLLLFANLFFFLHLALMWLRLGRRGMHPTLLVSAHAGSPHGPDGDIDNAGPAHTH